MNLLLNSDIVNLMLKPKEGGGRQKPNFVIFVVWSALSVGRWSQCEAESLVFVIFVVWSALIVCG